MRAARRLPRSEWAQARRIGASDVAKILGVSPYGTAWDVWTRLKGLDTRGPETEDQRRGHIWEGTVLDAYRRQTGLDVRGVEGDPILIDGPSPWSTVSPDGFVWDAGEVGLAEAKTDRFGGHWGESTEIERWSPECEAVVRPDYALQTYAQMYGADAPFVDLVVLLPYYELRCFRMRRDPDVEAELVDALDGWWARHVVEGAPPEIDGSYPCSRWVSERFRTVAPPRPATTDELDLALEYARLGSEIGDLEERRALVKNQLLDGLDGVRALDLSTAAPGARLTVVGPSQGRTFDHKAFAAANPGLDLESYFRTYERTASIRTYHLHQE